MLGLPLYIPYWREDNGASVFELPGRVFIASCFREGHGGVGHTELETLGEGLQWTLCCSSKQ